MSEEHINHLPMNEQDGYEHQDLSPKGVFYFMAGLVVLVIIIYLIVLGMFRFLDSYDKAHQVPISPMVAPQADTRTATHAETQAFPQPRLEENERNQLRLFVEDEDRRLATYNWVDKDKGIVQIPIDRAMDLLVERGLPLRPENARPENSAAGTSAPAKKPNPPAAKAAAGN